MTLSIFAAAAAVPDEPALIYEDEVLSFGELAALARRAQAMLRGLSVTAHHPAPFSLVAGNDRHVVATLLAAFALGAPVLLLHPRAPAAAHASLVESLGLRRAEVNGGAWPGIGPDAPGGAPPEIPADERPLVALPTSGTSGAAKVAVLSRRAVVAAAAASAANLGWETGDRWLLALPLAHIGGLSVVTRCLLARRAVVVASSSVPRVLAAAAERHRATLLSLVPTQLTRLLAEDWTPPPAVRAILVGGAPVSTRVLAATADRGWPVLTTYGLTEATSQVATQRYGSVQRGEAGAGTPLPGFEVAIRGGQVAIRGDALASGYAAPRRPDTLSPAGSLAVDALPRDAEGWFITGDLGHLDDQGRLHVHGRADQTILTGGEKVAPERVEAALAALTEIAEAAVVGVPDPVWGQRVVAAITWRSAPLAVDTLRGRLRSALAAFELPQGLVSMSELPRLPSGKVDRRALAARLVAGRSDP